MPEVSFDNLLIISVIAVLAPLLAGAVPRLRIPAVVLEIVAGIVVGPTGPRLGRGRPAGADPRAVRAGVPAVPRRPGDRPRRLRGRSLARCRRRLRAHPGARVRAPGRLLHAVGWVQQPLLIAHRAVGHVARARRPGAEGRRTGRERVGQTAIAAATVADFAAIVVLSFFFSELGGSAGAKVVLLAAFAALVGGDRRRGRSGRPVDAAGRPARPAAGHHRRDPGALAVVLLVAFVALASGSGWRASWARSWPARSSGSSTGTRRPIRIPRSSSTRSASGS